MQEKTEGKKTEQSSGKRTSSIIEPHITERHPVGHEYGYEHGSAEMYTIPPDPPSLVQGILYIHSLLWRGKIKASAGHASNRELHTIFQEHLTCTFYREQFSFCMMQIFHAQRKSYHSRNGFMQGFHFLSFFRFISLTNFIFIL